MADQSTCGTLIKQAHDELERNANNSMRAYDITMAQYNALLALGNCADGQLSLKELERMLHVAQSTAAGVIGRLEQKGLPIHSYNYRTHRPVTDEELGREAAGGQTEGREPPAGEEENASREPTGGSTAEAGKETGPARSEDASHGEDGPR